MPFAWRCTACKGKPIPGPPDEKPWVGACPLCRNFADAERVSVGSDEVEGAEIQPLKEGEAISLEDACAHAGDEDVAHVRVEISPGFDHVLGGGAPRGAAILLASPPGGGKSTLLVEGFRRIALRKKKALIVSTEETTKQFGRRYRRLGKFPPGLRILAERDVDKIEEVIRAEEPDAAALDSIHRIGGVTDDNEFQYSSGSLRAMELAAQRMKVLAEELDIPFFIVAHVTKDGNIAGVNGVQHDLDGTLYVNGQQKMQDGRLVIVGPDRTLRCDGKYRFGNPGQAAHFQMRGDGLHDLGPWTSERPPWLTAATRSSRPPRARSPRLRLVEPTPPPGED